MEFIQIFRFYVLFNILKSINAKDNFTRGDVQPVSDQFENMSYSTNPHLMPLVYKERIIKDVYVTKGYDAEIVPKYRSLTWVSYEISRFYVEDINELKKQLTVHIKMTGTWVDSRIKANLSGYDNNIIWLPPFEMSSPRLLWTPFKHLFIPRLISRKHTYYPIKLRFFKLYSSKSLSFGRFPPNTLLVSAAINQRVVKSCDKSIWFLHYPHDVNYCNLRMKSEYVNATFDIKSEKREQFFYRRDLLGFEVSNSKLINAKLKATSEREFNYTEFGVEIKLQRRFENYIYEYYVPCILIVLASTLSFIIPLSAIPGRIGLVVTLFLTLTNMFIYERVYFIFTSFYIF